MIAPVFTTINPKLADVPSYSSFLADKITSEQQLPNSHDFKLSPDILKLLATAHRQVVASDDHGRVYWRGISTDFLYL